MSVDMRLPAVSSTPMIVTSGEALAQRMAALNDLERAALLQAKAALPKANAAVAMRTVEIAQNVMRAATAASNWKPELPHVTYRTPSGKPLPSDAEPFPPGAYVHPDAFRELARAALDAPAKGHDPADGSDAGR